MLDLQEVDAPRRAAVAIDAIAVSRSTWKKENRRPAALTAREGLAAVAYESMFVWTVAGNIRAGTELTEADFERLTIAVRRIVAVNEEVQ